MTGLACFKNEGSQKVQEVTGRMIINNQQLKALAGGRPGGRKGEIREICFLTLMGNLCAALPSCL